MAYLIYGENDLSLEEAVADFKASIQPPDLADFNITVLDGKSISFEELMATCDTIPFLSEKRLVIVNGLLGQFESARSSRRNGRATSRRESKLGAWDGLPEYIERVPPTTQLVFVDRRLNNANPMLSKLRSLVEVKTFPLPTGNELRRWIQQRAQTYKLDIDPKAIETLAETIGNDVRVVDKELEKLSLYRYGQTVRQQDVEEMVSYVREASIFAAVDSVLEGRPGTAIRLIHQILEAGQPATYVITMIARQVRLLLLARELKSQRLTQEEIGKRLSISGYPLRKTMEQGNKFTKQRLTDIHHKLLEADLALKSTGADDELILDLLIADLATPRRA